MQDTENLRQEKEAELARLNDEINRKHEELEAKEGQLLNKELVMDQLRKRALH